MIKYRIVIFDDEEMMRKLLKAFFEDVGYEVFTFEHPGLCTLSLEAKCICSHPCTDIILSDVHMPFQDGINLVKEQIKKGCKCENIALMTGDIEYFDLNIEKVKIFEKPIRILKIEQWINKIEKNIDPNRKLSSDWISQIK